MKELIGYECSCVFSLPFNDWPIEGYPAWVKVVAVDMPMICLQSIHAGKPIWMHCSIIQTITKA